MRDIFRSWFLYLFEIALMSVGFAVFYLFYFKQQLCIDGLVWYEVLKPLNWYEIHFRRPSPQIPLTNRFHKFSSPQGLLSNKNCLLACNFSFLFFLFRPFYLIFLWILVCMNGTEVFFYLETIFSFISFVFILKKRLLSKKW